ncbi:hypothetical protein BDR26DRAFT_857293, partial [Obelidium mucronatum]
METPRVDGLRSALKGSAPASASASWTSSLPDASGPLPGSPSRDRERERDKERDKDRDRDCASPANLAAPRAEAAGPRSASARSSASGNLPVPILDTHTGTHTQTTTQTTTQAQPRSLSVSYCDPRISASAAKKTLRISAAAPRITRIGDGDEDEDEEEERQDVRDEMNASYGNGSKSLLPGKYSSLSRNPLGAAKAQSFASSLNHSTTLLYFLGEKTIQVIQSTFLFKMAVIALNSNKIQIYAYSAFNLFMIIVTIVLVLVIEGFALPSIKFYNFIHAFLGAVGKMTIISGYGLCQLIGKDYVANSLIKTKRGIPLSSIARPPTSFIPPNAFYLRYAFLASLLSVEGAIWYLLLQMKWTGIVSSMGLFPCIPATYPTAPLMPRDLGNFMMGETSLSSIYNYGLPLSDGLVGGFSAYPLVAPSKEFIVEGKGAVYAFSVVCSDPVAALQSGNTNQKPHTLSLEIVASVLENYSYNATISITIPAESHDFTSLIDQDVIQYCDIVYTINRGVIKFNFVADEWGMVAGGQIQEIRVSSKLVVKHKSSTHVSTKDVMKTMNPLLHDDKEAINLIKWFADALKLMFDHTTYSPMEFGAVPSLFQWGRNNDGVGLFDVDHSWQAIGGAIGAVSHYLLLQYNQNVTGSCAFSGIQEAGVIDMPSNTSLIIVTASAICLFLHLVYLIRWIRCSGGNALNDHVALILNSPLLLLHHMREMITKCIRDIENGDHSTRSIQRHLSKVKVKIGEDVRTVGDAKGSILIHRPKRVVSLSLGREYVGSREQSKSSSLN